MDIAFDEMLKEGKLIELCSGIKNNRSAQNKIREWYRQHEKSYITPLKTSKEIDQSLMLNASCMIGLKLVDERITTTQLRRLIAGFQKLQEKYKTRESKPDESEISRLRLNIAYIVARHKKIMVLGEVLDAMLSKVETKEDFDSIVTLLEGVITYHKLAGGGD